MTESGPRSRLDSSDLADVLAALEAAFRMHAAELDALNVFPVPDGDTGANMLGTIVAAREDTTDVDSAVRGAVIGARGNSGVILSQVLRALLEALDEGLTGSSLPDVLAHADQLARAAVAEPVEGTMLTVLSTAATAAAGHGGELPDRLAALLGDVGDAVADTEFVLEANRTAGVVDAGARGVEVWLRAVHDHVHGVAITPPPLDEDEGDPGHVVSRAQDEPAEREQGSEEFRWEVQYLLDDLREPDTLAVATLKDSLTGLGDSVVVVSTGDLLNVHVHTNQIGAAVEAGLALGHPRRVAVTDFEADSQQPEEAAAVGLVVVLPGAVLAELAAGDGVQVVDGRAGALPTVGALLDAARRTHASEVLVVPGHRNAVPTALQAAATGDLTMHVVANADALPKAVATLAAWDPAGSAPDLAAAMDDAAGHCRDGEVVAAVRAANTSLGSVEIGDFLGLVDDQVITKGRDARDVAADVVAALMEDGGEIIMVVAGASAPRRERKRIIATAERSGLEVEAFVTDAEPARYWFGVE